jgi:hypothetical protein
MASAAAGLSEQGMVGWSTAAPQHGYVGERLCTVLQLLNAKPENVERESETVAQSGRKGAVTIATNMAGRGTDILLGGNSEYMARLKLRENLLPKVIKCRGLCCGHGMCPLQRTNDAATCKAWWIDQCRSLLFAAYASNSVVCSIHAGGQPG